MFGFNRRQKSSQTNKPKKNYDYEYCEDNLDFTSDKKDEYLEETREKVFLNFVIYLLQEEMKESDNLNIKSNTGDFDEKYLSQIVNNKNNNKMFIDYVEDSGKQFKPELNINLNVKEKEKFPKKEKQSYNLLKYLYNDSSTDNLNTNIQNKYKQSSDLEENVIHDMDAEILYPQHDQSEEDETKSENLQEEIDYNVINSQLSESESENKKFKNKIKEIKDLRHKKRETDHKEETYDQDYLEMKQTKTSALIEDVYNLYESNELYNLKDIEQQSDSEKEILQWELEKLKHGINSKWAMNKQKKTKEENINKNIFEIFNTIKLKPVKICEVVKKVEDDLINTELNYESLKVRKENYESEILENISKKEEHINKADEYIQKYLRLKEIYYKIIKGLKKNGKINADKFKNMLQEEDNFNLTD